MRTRYAAALIATLGLLMVPADMARSADRPPGPPYPLGPDSERHDGVPVGTVTRHEFRSRIFEGTLRQYYLYVPAQYDAEAGTPAALMVFQDGHAYVDEKGEMRAPVVFDNLIARGEMPVTIGLFVNPGWFTGSIDGRQGWDTPEGVRSNRSVEYDTLDDAYVRMLDEELIPEATRELRISKDPAMRAIGGMSSGGICAFTAAWERPQSFGKVLSHIGSFTNIRGGHQYPALIRKSDAKPIRVFLQDGLLDLDNAHGNWWLGNRQMEAALRFKDYDLRTVWGLGGHNGRHGGAILPATLRWLWRAPDAPGDDPAYDFGPTLEEPGAFVFLANPTSGATVRSGFTISGLSRTFEGDVQWRLLDRQGKVMAQGHATGGGVDGPATFRTTAEFKVDQRQLGHLEVYEEDVSDGEGFAPARNVVPVVLEP